MELLLALALAQEPRYSEDFENRQSLDVVYDGWERLRSPAHPAYNGLAVEADPAARSGRHVLRIVSRGGATALRMDPAAAWRIDPSRPWRLTVHARMSGASRNAAVASVEWLDRHQEPLRTDASEPLPAAAEWTPIVLDVRSPPPAALFARVTLEYGGPDVRGECRFDALGIEATALLDLAPVGQPLAIVEPGVAPRFEAVALGLPPAEYRLSLQSRAPGAAVAHRVGPLAIRPGRPCLAELPVHAPGYYDVLAEVAGPAGVVLRTQVPLVVPHPWIFRPSGPRWIGMSVNLFARELPDPAALAQLAGGDRIRLTFADRPLSGRKPPEAARMADAVRLLAAADHARITGILARPTTEFFPGLAPEDLESRGTIFSPLRRDAWEAPLKALAGRYTGVVDRWELGPLRLRADLLPDPAPATASFLPLPAGTDLAATAAFARDLLARASAGDRALEPYLPLDVPLVDSLGRPRPALVALRTLNDLLTNARYWPEAPKLLNLRELAFEREGLTIVAFWNDVETEREAHLGDGTTIHPLLGAARPHRPGERLRIGPMPFLAVRKNDAALEIQAGLQFFAPGLAERPDSTLPLRVDPAARTLRFRNLSPDETLTDVRIRLQDPFPPGWQVRPLELRAAELAPQTEVSQDLLFALPTGSEEQSRDLTIELSFRKGGVEQRVRLTRTIEVRSAIGVEIDSTPDGPTGRKVSIRLSNRSLKPLSFLARIRLPGLPERTEPLGPLEPGASRTLGASLRDLHLVDPTRLLAEVVCEEHGGDRARARLSAPLR